MFKVRCDYRHINYIGIVLVYFLNGMPFVYDDVPEVDKDDPYVKAIADSEDPIDIEQLTRNRSYGSTPWSVIFAGNHTGGKTETSSSSTGNSNG